MSNAKHTPQLGCYGDGTFGHDHTRTACAALINELLAHYVPGDLWSKAAVEAVPTVKALAGEMSDDASEEYDACDWLNTYAPHDSATWDWRDGDFGLWPSEEDDNG